MAERASSRVFLRRVTLKNYKSIAACRVELGPLTYLVGANGAGKSNFIDALRLVADALERPLDWALRERGGINDVRRRSTGHPHNVGIRIDFGLRDGSFGHYAFEITAPAKATWSVNHEECVVGAPPLHGAEFVVENGHVKKFTGRGEPPAAFADRLFLVNASGSPEFRAVYDALTHMGFYSLDPRALRSVQDPDPGEILARDGRNLPSVIGRLSEEAPETKRRIEEFLEHIAPGLVGVDRKSLAGKEALEFRQAVKGAQHPWRFYASSISDGTLRSLAVLVALFQSLPEQPHEVSLMTIEEPEIALHPAATAVLLDALREASEHTQVIVTTHSPDLLDSADVASEELLAVEASDGTTVIGRLDETGRGALRNKLYTPGELLRMAKLHPENGATGGDRASQTELFGDAVER